MADLSIQVTGAETPLHAASPRISFELEVANDPPDERIHSVILQCQIRIEAPRRRYNAREKEKLVELFGEPERWGQTLSNRLWTHAHMTIPPFTGRTTVELPVTCTYDMNVAGSKYLYALEEDEAPLLFLFSGSIFYADRGRLQVVRISWDREARYRLPAAVWQDMMDHYYPNTAWLYLRRDVFERLYRFKRDHGLTTWEQAVEKLLPDENNRNGEVSE